MNQRLSDLCRRMEEEGMDAALLLHHRDVLYYAGTARPASLLVAPEPPTARLLARRGIEEIQREAAVENVEPMRGFSSIVRVLGELGLEDGVLGIELDTTPFDLYERIVEAFAGWDVVDVTPLVMGQRLWKDEDEIAATRRAAEVADAAHRALARVAEAGMSELELAAEVERAMRLAGHEGYQPLRRPEGRGGGVFLMSGENLAVRGGHGLIITGAGLSPATPYGASRRVLQQGDMIVLDTGTIRDCYTADESRTFVLGEPTEAQQALFDLVAETHQAVLRQVVPYMPVSTLYAVAEGFVGGGAPPFFGRGELVLPGFVGHGIGLELDEPPVLWPRDQTSRLGSGMVLAIETEVSAPGAGMMAKLEDTVVVRSGKPEILTGAPRTLTVCG